tara:strand:- start:3094 stop:3279 length:186 start_codon:yes stop_codon:yes gene_type:complete
LEGLFGVLGVVFRLDMDEYESEKYYASSENVKEVLIPIFVVLFICVWPVLLTEFRRKLAGY